ncbi:MAG: hypothetical protein ABJG42_24480 [Vibrio splendidus]
MSNPKEKFLSNLNLINSDRFFSESDVPRIITSAVRNSSKSQADLARELNLNSNLITMFKQGRTKIPIARAREVAIALDLDTYAFVRMILEEYYSDILFSIESTFAFSSDESETKAFKSLREFMEENECGIEDIEFKLKK